MQVIFDFLNILLIYYNNTDLLRQRLNTKSNLVDITSRGTFLEHPSKSNCNWGNRRIFVNYLFPLHSFLQLFTQHKDWLIFYRKKEVWILVFLLKNCSSDLMPCFHSKPYLGHAIQFTIVLEALSERWGPFFIFLMQCCFRVHLFLFGFNIHGISKSMMSWTSLFPPGPH